MRHLASLLPVTLLVLAPQLGGCQPRTAVASPPETQAAAPFPNPPVLAGTPDVATLVARVKPAVVNITVVSDVPHPQVTDGDDEGLPGLIPGLPGFSRLPNGAVPRRVGQGTGFIVTPEGRVVTNAHVVEGARQVKVRLADDRELKAKVVGTDPSLDVAVLQLEGAKDLPVVSLGGSEGLRVGEYVVAIGNPFGLSHTVTMGIVSAKARSIGAGPYDDFIQTDASINPGNSGGPLFDLHGQVVGINTAINPQGKGIGFAIPIDAVKDVVPQLVATGKVQRGRLGVHIQPVDVALAKAVGLDRSRGAMVAEVEPGSPAERAGMKPGDVITAVDGQTVARSEELPRIVARHRPGSTVKVDVLRDNAPRAVSVVLDALPTPQAARADEPDEAPTATTQHAPGLGIQVRDAPPGAGGGAVVERVVPGGPAEGDLRRGDVVVEVDRTRVANAADVAKRVQAAPPGKPVLLKVRRGDGARYVAIDPR